jgi:lipopolysaccharide transport system ATP-binding protein
MSGQLHVQNLGKSYRQWGSELRRVASWFLPFIKPREEHWVLKDVSFSINPGEAVGIIGQNGAGKSTLLKLITGTTYPTLGEVQLHGRVAAILELGMGFNPDLTGRQNAYHSAGLMGYSQADIVRTMPEIEAFAEVGEYFDQPVRTYSSGMQMRVAFSVATAVRPDILIVDEALSVGDSFFQHKCMQRIRKFQERGTSLLLVSHSPDTIRALCQRGIVLVDGMIAMIGDAASVMDFYRASQVLRMDASPDEQLLLTETDPLIESRNGKVVLASKRVGAIGVEIISDKSVIYCGDAISICVSVDFQDDFQEPHIGFGLRNKMGVLIYEASTYTLKHKTYPVAHGEKLIVTFSFPCRVAPGTYEISIGVADTGYDRGLYKTAIFFDQSFMLFEVVADGKDGWSGWTGIYDLQPEIRIS